VCRYGIKYTWDLLHNSWDLFFFLKTILLNQIFFLYLCKAEYFFVANAVTDYLISFPSNNFLGKNHNPHPFKLNGRSLMSFLCLNLCYLFYQSLAQCCFCLFMWMCVYLCMSVTVFICMHGVFCVSLLFVFNNISRFKSSTELMFACLFVYMSSDFK
jgi:hypothetical protein